MKISIHFMMFITVFLTLQSCAKKDGFDERIDSPECLSYVQSKVDSLAATGFKIKRLGMIPDRESKLDHFFAVGGYDDSVQLKEISIRFDKKRVSTRVSLRDRGTLYDDLPDFDSLSLKIENIEDLIPDGFSYRSINSIYYSYPDTYTLMVFLDQDDKFFFSSYVQSVVHTRRELVPAYRKGSKRGSRVKQVDTSMHLFQVIIRGDEIKMQINDISVQ